MNPVPKIIGLEHITNLLLSTEKLTFPGDPKTESRPDPELLVPVFDILCPYLPERWREVLRCGRPHSDNTVSLDPDMDKQPIQNDSSGQMIHINHNVEHANKGFEVDDKRIAQKAIPEKIHATDKM